MKRQIRDSEKNIYKECIQRHLKYVKNSHNSIRTKQPSDNGLKVWEEAAPAGVWRMSDSVTHVLSGCRVTDGARATPAHWCCGLVCPPQAAPLLRPRTRAFLHRRVRCSAKDFSFFYNRNFPSVMTCWRLPFWFLLTKKIQSHGTKIIMLVNNFKKSFQQLKMAQRCVRQDCSLFCPKSKHPQVGRSREL